MNKRLSMLLIFILLFQPVFGNLFLTLQTGAEGAEKSESIFTGTALTAEDGATINIDETDGETAVNLHVDWSIKDLTVEGGSTESLPLPENLRIDEEQEGILTIDELELGTYQAAEDGEITVTFNELIEENQDVEGKFVVEVVLVGVEEVATIDKTTEDEEVENDEEEENIATSSVAAIQPYDARDLGDIFTFVSLRIGGDVIEDTSLIEIDEFTVAELEFSWNTETLGAKNGDIASITMAEAFAIVTTTRLPIEIDEKPVGTYHIKDGVLTFEFNEGIETSDVHNGYVNLGLEFNLDIFRENIEQEIPFRDNSENSITVIARPNLDHSGINKEGHPDTQHDAREIIWTIDVLNTNDEEITGATLADNIPEGLGTARDFVIHELSVGFDGDLRDGTDVTSTINPTGFPIEFDAIAPFRGYRVQYTTTIENYAAESFTNAATFEYDEEPLTAESTVDGLTRSNPIEKEGSQVGDSDVIQWQIDVNKNGSIISEAIVEDELPDGLTIDPDSIAVVRITQSGGNWDEGDPHENSFVKFPIELGALGQEDAYRIKFETTVDWEDVNKGYYQENNGFQNKTTLYDGEDELNDDDATVNIERDPILRKTGASNVDYNNKTVTWTIHINEAGHPIGNVVLKDLIPEGLAITEDNIDITDVTEEQEVSYTPDSINLAPNADGGTEVVIELGNVGTRQLKVEYTTTITDFTKNSFNNTVGMTGIGIGPDGEHDNANISPAGNTYGKSFSGINYKEKTIDWQLTVDPRREAIDSLTIEDTFSNKGMILLPNTVDVSFAGEKLVENTDYTLVPRTEDGETGYHKGFIITILDNALPLNGGQLVVDYQTSYDPQRVVDGNTLDPFEPNEDDNTNNTDRLYVNHVHYTGETVNGYEIDIKRTASQRVRVDSWNSGKKEGQLVHFDGDNKVNGWISGSERKIAWQLYFNYQKQDLGTGVVVTDTLDYEGAIDEDSIQVSVYNVNPNGTTGITGPILEQREDTYSVNVEGNEFTLTFAEDFVVAERYVIEFRTSVPDISIEKYTNKAIVTVGGVEYDYSATLNYKEHGDFLGKKAVNLDGDSVFTGDEVEWEVTVNESLSVISNAEIIDTISAGHVYLLGTLNIFKTQDRENALEVGTDYELEVVVVTDDNDDPTGETNLVINIIGDLQDTLVLEYTTVVTETDGKIGNSISLDGTSIDQQVEESEKLGARQFSSVGGEWAWNSERGALRVTKVDAETEEIIENNEATFTLWYDLNGTLVQFGDEEYRNEGGILEIINLPFRTYYLREVAAPKGYVLAEADDLEIVVEISVGDENEPNFAEEFFENTKEKIDITGTKIWENGPQPDIQLQLFRNGAEYLAPVTLATGNTEYEWSDLDKTDIDGNEYEYKIDEVVVPENYEKSISADGLTITNTFVSPLIDIPVQKIWEDENNQDGIRPESIEVQLLANDEDTNLDNLILNAENEWEDEFTGLPKLDNDGEEITYTVVEINVPGDYEVDIVVEDSGEVTITNSYEPESIEVAITKEWFDEEDLAGFRPNHIEVELYEDGEATGKVIAIVADEEGVWEGAFINLPKYRDAGTAIVYTIAEVSIDEELYHVEIIPGEADEDGNVYEFTLINTHEVEYLDVDGEKTWNDANNQDGIRPNSITVNLLANGEQVDSTEVTEDDSWSYSFTGLPVYAAGEEIIYTITENSVTEYSTEIDGFDITNHYTPGQTSVTVTKAWDDENDQDRIRPESIEVQLTADGELLRDPVELSLENNWTHTWTELDEKAAGDSISYSVVEVTDLAEYEVSVNDDDHGNIIVTNSYTPETVDVAGVKTWDDANNQDSIRPDSITVNLLANGVPVDSVEVTAEANWEYSFTDLAKYEAGEEIEYSITEIEVEGYETVIDEFEITNSYTPETTDIFGTKTWDDADNEEGIRPDSITVNLLANGEQVASVEVTEADDWNYSFVNLPKYQDGEEIVYSVTEDAVEGYESTVIEYDITNTLEPIEAPDEPEDDPVDTSGEDTTVPKTATNIYNLLIAGFTLLLFGLIVLLFNRKKKAIE